MKSIGYLMLVISIIYPIYFFYNNKLLQTDKNKKLIYIIFDKKNIDKQFDYFHKNINNNKLFENNNVPILKEIVF